MKFKKKERLLLLTFQLQLKNRHLDGGIKCIDSLGTIPSSTNIHVLSYKLINRCTNFLCSDFLIEYCHDDLTLITFEMFLHKFLFTHYFCISYI